MRELLTLASPVAPAPTSPFSLAVTIAIALVVIWTPVWHVARLGVTLVHELGHAVVGICCGRRFTGFVVRGDMSGHAVTSGPAKGFSRVATTWAGYPMPALLGALLVWTAMRGWGPPVLTLILLVLTACLIMIRSLTTVLVLLTAILVTAALWWSGADAVQQHVLVGAGLVLIVGAWRHFAAVARAGGGNDDPAVLARLTRIPRVFWLLTFVLACAGATWAAVTVLLPGV